MQSKRWSLMTALFAAAALFLAPTVASALDDSDIVRAEPDEINEPYDELSGYDEREVVAGQTLTSLDDLDVNLDNPTLGGLVDSSESISVIRISSSSTDLGSECEVFYGAEFEVNEVLMGSAPPMNQRRLGRVDQLSTDECSFIRSESDVDPYFNNGELYIFFASSDWGDVVLPYSMLDDVRELTD